MKNEAFDIQPLTIERWPDLEKVLGKSGKSGCWCMYWIAPSSKAWGEGTPGGSRAINKAAFRNVVSAGPPPGLIAYKDGDPVAWCRITPRTSLPGLANSRYFKTELDIEGVWSLSCFAVRTPYRGKGLTTILTEAAADFARQHRARILEVYPTDTEEQKHPSVLYTGHASTFSRLGFKEVQRKNPHKPMMRLEL